MQLVTGMHMITCAVTRLCTQLLLDSIWIQMPCRIQCPGDHLSDKQNRPFIFMLCCQEMCQMFGYWCDTVLCKFHYLIQSGFKTPWGNLHCPFAASYSEDSGTILKPTPYCTTQDCRNSECCLHRLISNSLGSRPG